MYRRIALYAVALVLATCASVPILGTGLLAGARGQDRLIVHEWGTFTSVVDQTGAELVWRPLSGPTDLPGFVYGIGANGRRPGARNNPAIKLSLNAKIRMETPVVYFYADRETAASLKVEFPQGYVTEWYPAGAKTGTGIVWESFTILPGSSPGFPVESAESRYYAARRTDASPVRVSGSNGPEDEKFLFYRGIGNFDLPISVKLKHGNVTLKATTGTEIPEAIFFQKAAGREGYQIQALAGGRSVFRPEGALLPTAALRGELVRMLVDAGLYEKEAQAMLDTWGDSWSEPGERIFYIFPRNNTDSVLPMTIDPQPTQLERVLVCRAEIITPEMEEAVAQQIKALGSDSAEVSAAAETMIRRHGRFLEPILERLSQKAYDSTTKARVDELTAAVMNLVNTD